MSQIASNGGQPQKQPKYAAIYTGRFFNGINTNRSPLRAASAGHIQEKFYSDASGDALIAGANLEVTNRLTLARRPGAPIYDTSHVNGYHRPLAFSDFRVNKAASDAFGTTLESIYTMVDQTDRLQSLTSALVRGGDASYFGGLNFSKSSGAGQSFMQPVGNSLYFANGVDNKKWLTSLFTRTSAGNNNFLQGTDGLAGTYPFGTYLIDPATGNIQQFIGISIGAVTSVAVLANTLTLSVTLSPDTNDYAVGTSFLLWGMTTNTFLNGATITLTAVYTHASSTTLVASFNHSDLTTTAESGPGYIIQAGTTPVIAETGGSVPTYNTTVPSSVNNFTGGLTKDGNTIWVNRGSNVENWGIKAPTKAPTFNVAGSEGSWAASTYYSPASIFLDPLHGNLWQVTTAGTTGSTQPAWSASPRHQQKVVISSVAIASNVVTFITDTQSPALVAGDTVVVKDLAVASFLEGKTLTVSATGLSTTGFQAAFTFSGTYAATADYGFAIKTGGTNPPTTLTDGTVVWTCIQLAASLTWAAGTHYNEGDFIMATVGGKAQFFQLGAPSVPFLNSTPSLLYFVEPQSEQNSSAQGAVPFYNSADTNSPGPGQNWGGSGDFATPLGPTTLSSLNCTRSGSADFFSNTVNGAGETTGASVDMGVSASWDGSFTATVFIPAPGQYTFTLIHSDGAFFSFDISTGAYKTNGVFTPASGGAKHQLTAQKGYGKPDGSSLCGNNNSQSTPVSDSATWFFPTAGNYGIEIDYAKWYHSTGTMQFVCPGPTATQNIPVGRDISGSTTPVFPGFTVTGAHYDTVNQQIVWGASVSDNTTSKVYLWSNIGFVSDFLWQALTPYTLPGTTIIDKNASQEGAYETGVSGKTQPTWQTTINAITADSDTLTWINEGSVPAVTNAGNTITATSAQGWIYWIALVNTLDQTVSNLSPVSLPTGPVVKGQITFPAGAGLNPAAIDSQADYVAIFRSADGFSTPLLIPGFVNSPYTVPLAQYLNYGYVDTVPDVELNNLVQGPLGLENTPPVAGAANLTYHLNRIWYSVGNTVFWTSGPLAPVGNGDGTAPGNSAACPSQVKRLVPTAIGMIVLTQSDVYIIAGNGTNSNPILPAIPYLIGVGLGNYNALDVNGGLIGFFTTDKQFVIFDPSAGLNYVGFNIGDQFRLNNGLPGQSWQPSKVYVAWYINGEDAGWYVADGINGWYRLIYTPAPEQGSVAWSPFATIQGTCGAIASIETSPGVHELLIGQTAATTSSVLSRDIDATTDNGTTGSTGTAYPAFGVIGSIVLANPGQIAKIAHITTVCVKVGSPLVMGVILNEALPYYKGAFDILKHSVSDPPGLPESRSFYRQRFYLAENEEASAYCMDLQVLVQFPPEAAQNELQTLTIFGAYEVEQ